MDNNLVLVRLLHIHGADINKTDSDSWTPLHAAAANGYHSIVSYLLSHGADPHKRTEEGETALDLVEEDDLMTVRVLQETKDEVEVARRLSVAHVARQEKKEPAWVRRMSLQEAARRESVKEVEVEVDTRRKGSAWVGKEEIPEEEEADEEEEGEIRTQSTDVKHEEEIKRDIKTVRLKPPAPPAGARQRRTGRLEPAELSQQSNNVRLQFLSSTNLDTNPNTNTNLDTNTNTNTNPDINTNNHSGDSKSSENKVLPTDTKSQQSLIGQINTPGNGIKTVKESESKESQPKALNETDTSLKFSAERPAVVRLESKDR